MTFDKSLSKASEDLRRNSNRDGVPSGMRDSVMAAVSDLQVDGRLPNFRSAPRLLGVALTISVVAVGFGSRLILNHAASVKNKSRLQPQRTKEDPTASLRAEISAAVESANTWHLSRRTTHRNAASNPHAVKLSNPVDQMEEIWGRQTPFFYRQERNGEIVMDDGTKRYHLIPAGFSPPDKASGTPGHALPEMLIVRPSTGSGTFDGFNNGSMGSINELQRMLVGSKAISPGTASLLTGDGYSIYEGVPTDDAASREVTGSPRTIDHSIKTIESVSANTSNFMANRSPNIQTLETPDDSIMGTRGMPTSPMSASQSTASHIWDLTIDAKTLLPKRYSEVSDSLSVMKANSKRGGFSIENRLSDVFIPTYNRALPPDVLTLTPRAKALTLEVVSEGPTASNNSWPSLHVKGLEATCNLIGRDKSGILKCELHWQFDGKPMDYSSLAKLLPIVLWDISAVDQAGKRYVVLGDRGLSIDATNEYIIAPLEPASFESRESEPITLQVRIEVLGVDKRGTMVNNGPGYVVPIMVRLKAAPEAKISNDIAPSSRDGVDAMLRLGLTAARSDYYLRLLAANGSPSQTGSSSNPASRTASADSLTNSLVVVSPPVRIPTKEDYTRAAYWTSAAIREAEKSGNKGLARIYWYRLQSIKPPR